MKMPGIIDSDGFPITLAFSKKGRAFFSERITGNLWEILDNKFRLIHSFPIVKITGHHETGLLGIALDPDFEKNEYIYCFYTYSQARNSLTNKIVRIKVGKPSEKVVCDNIPGGLIHNGGIMAFGPDMKLYIGVGIGNEIKEKAQDVKFLGGKILRINPNGTIPNDNPFKDSPAFSFGHRNIFGLAFHPKTGRLYICEEGPDRDDEINIIEKGGNYGWPNVTGLARKNGFIDPIISYTPTITPTQCLFDGKFFYFGSYNEGTVHRLTFGNNGQVRVVKDEIVYQGKSFGVIGVFKNPKGEFFVTTPNKIIRFNPNV